MSFDSDISSSARFTRVDSGKSVDVFYNPNVVSGNPKMSSLMQKIMQKQATNSEKIEFGEIWQDRVKRILIDNFDNEEMIRVS